MNAPLTIARKGGDPLLLVLAQYVGVTLCLASLVAGVWWLGYAGGSLVVASILATRGSP
jgi:hypothetical protein